MLEVFENHEMLARGEGKEAGGTESPTAAAKAAGTR